MSSTDDELLIERGTTTTITLNRPDSLNALSMDLVRQMRSVLQDLRDDVECRTLVLTGAGRGFCSGADMKAEVQGRSWGPPRGNVQTGYTMQESFSELPWLLRRIPQPVIVVVNGVAAGGGLALALAADIRVVEPNASFVASFVNIGVSGGEMGTSYFLPRLVGFDRAAELLYTGRRIDAHEADSIGLVTHLVEEGEGMGKAHSIAEEIQRIAPASTRMTKSLLSLSMEGGTLQQQIELENRTQIMLGETADYIEGVRSFVERREARYTDH